MHPASTVVALLLLSTAGARAWMVTWPDGAPRPQLQGAEDWPGLRLLTIGRAPGLHGLWGADVDHARAGSWALGLLLDESLYLMDWRLFELTEEGSWLPRMREDWQRRTIGPQAPWAWDPEVGRGLPLWGGRAEAHSFFRAAAQAMRMSNDSMLWQQQQQPGGPLGLTPAPVSNGGRGGQAEGDDSVQFWLADAETLVADPAFADGRLARAEEFPMFTWQRTSGYGEVWVAAVPGRGRRATSLRLVVRTALLPLLEAPRGPRAGWLMPGPRTSPLGADVRWRLPLEWMEKEVSVGESHHLHLELELTLPVQIVPGQPERTPLVPSAPVGEGHWRILSLTSPPPEGSLRQELTWGQVHDLWTGMLDSPQALQERSWDRCFAAPGDGARELSLTRRGPWLDGQLVMPLRGVSGAFRAPLVPPPEGGLSAQLAHWSVPLAHATGCELRAELTPVDWEAAVVPWAGRHMGLWKEAADGRFIQWSFLDLEHEPQWVAEGLLQLEWDIICRAANPLQEEKDVLDEDCSSLTRRTLLPPPYTTVPGRLQEPGMRLAAGSATGSSPRPRGAEVWWWGGGGDVHGVWAPARVEPTEGAPARFVVPPSELLLLRGSVWTATKRWEFEVASDEWKRFDAVKTMGIRKVTPGTIDEATGVFIPRAGPAPAFLALGPECAGGAAECTFAPPAAAGGARAARLVVMSAREADRIGAGRPLSAVGTSQQHRAGSPPPLQPARNEIVLIALTLSAPFAAVFITLAGLYGVLPVPLADDDNDGARRGAGRRKKRQDPREAIVRGAKEAEKQLASAGN